MATKTIASYPVNKIRVGGNTPKSIYKGSAEVLKVYKGSTLVYHKTYDVYVLSLNSSSNSFSSSGGNGSILVQSTKNEDNFTNLSYSTAGTTSFYTINNWTYNLSIPNVGTRNSLSYTVKSGLAFDTGNGGFYGSRSSTITITQGISGLSAEFKLSQTHTGPAVWPTTLSNTGYITIQAAFIAGGTTVEELYYRSSTDNNLSKFSPEFFDGSSTSGTKLTPQYGTAATPTYTILVYLPTKPTTMTMKLTYGSYSGSWTFNVS